MAEDTAPTYMTSEGTKEATERIQEELKQIKSLDEAKIGFSASPSGQDLYHWNIRLRDFDYDTDLGQARIVLSLPHFALPC